MAYTQKHSAASAAASPVSLGSVADVFVAAQAFAQKVSRIEFLVTTAVVSTGAAIVSVFQRPTHGSTSAQVLLGTLSIPNGATVGQCYYKEISDAPAFLPVQAGQELVFGVTTATAGGGAAGAGICLAVLDESPEVALNQSNFVLSA